MITLEELADESLDADIECAHETAEFLLNRDVRAIRALGDDHEHTMYAMWLKLTRHLATLGFKPASLSRDALHHATEEIAREEEEEEPDATPPTVQ